jgi:hypothetical protein
LATLALPSTGIHSPILRLTPPALA